jgi:hypothetical protein
MKQHIIKDYKLKVQHDFLVLEAVFISSQIQNIWIQY